MLCSPFSQPASHITLWTESKGGRRADSPVNHKHHLTQPVLWIPTDSSAAVCNNSRQSFLTAGSAASFNLSAAFIGLLLHPASLPPSIRWPVRSLDEPSGAAGPASCSLLPRFQFAVTLTSLVSVPRRPSCVGVPC